MEADHINFAECFRANADESPSGFAWRAARYYGMSLRQFASASLGLRWDQIQGDLDSLFATPKVARMLANITGVPDEEISQLCPKQKWLCSTWNKSERRHTARIYVCPDCLSCNTPIARRAWRTKFAGVCTIHRRFLVGACSNCGEVLRYQTRCAGSSQVPWLDAWPTCPVCLGEIEQGGLAPEVLLDLAIDYESLMGVDSNIETNRAVLGSLVEKIWRRLKGESELVQSIAINLGLPGSSNHFALLGLMAFRSLVHWRHIGRDCLSTEPIVRFVLGLPTNRHDVLRSFRCSLLTS
jgi:hypothetical protein